MVTKKPRFLRIEEEITKARESGERIFSVSTFLELVNTALKTFEVKIKGEISSVNERGGHWYFDLKDKNDGSVISCLMWRSSYRLNGLNFKEGMEVIIHGWPSVYKPNGRLSFQADTIELVGEGALKRQYEELKNKLDKEGLFSLERKKTIPVFPQKIGLITSRQGEAIFDFRTNLGKFGFKIKFVDSRVEGIQAVPGLIKALRFFKKQDIDVLVLVRGGGSLESLLSFNNEALVREIANFSKPIVTGIGHEQDVSLSDLVADQSCSTPTGVAKLLSYGWEQALAQVNLVEKDIWVQYQNNLADKKYILENHATHLQKNFRAIFEYFQRLQFELKNIFLTIGISLKKNLEYLSRASEGLILNFKTNLQSIENQVKLYETSIYANNPERQLCLGYSLVRVGGKIIKSVTSVGKGEEIRVELSDGEIMAETKNIRPKVKVKN